MQYTYSTDKPYTTFCCRFNTNILKKGTRNSQINLAAVMEGEGSGNRDEYFAINFARHDFGTDDLGRPLGIYLMTTKGKR